jgi:uncharacterized protein YbbC (DUF1343 family)/CubicO group peptidase (beta-lactamase class C family)
MMLCKRGGQFSLTFGLCVGLLLASKPLAAATPEATPEAAGMDPAGLAHIDAAIAAALQDQRMPGCVVCLGRRDKIAFLKAYGHKQVEPEKTPMTTDTVFDLASLTKPIATATSIMLLVERGQLRLADNVALHLPEFEQNGKDDITIQHLLTHQGGLIPDNALSDYLDGPEKAWERIFALSPRDEPGTKFVYTDVGFLVLGKIVERLSGQNIHQFSHENIFSPLGMYETGYLPDEALRTRAAPTEKRNDHWMQGEVHDPRAFHLGGVAGHAGLFSTAKDLAVYAQMMLGRGQRGETRIMSENTWRVMTRPNDVTRGKRGLGWDMQTGYSSNRGELFSPAAFGHGGFTGTAIWIDPELDLFVVFLSNRVHPRGEGSVNPLAGRIGSIAAAAIQRQRSESVVKGVASGLAPRSSASALTFDTLTGIDVLVRDGFQPLEGRKIGLITNHTGVDRSGVSTVQRLDEAKNCELVALFSPEHGIAGQLDVSKIGDSRDEQRDLPIFSLYGESRRPTPEMLTGLDTLVFDIQDIGTRYYTYISTMGEAMRAAAEHKLRFVVLDRPNPINGVDVDGPVLDAGQESFVGFHTLPVRHGMTAGELAQMFNREMQFNVDLQVVRVENWRRSDYYDATGLVWINPSPNMRNLNQAVLYPAIGLLETTNLSVGRGTDAPFEQFGAPWLNGDALAKELNQAQMPGVAFVPLRFTPASSKFAGELCSGVNVIVTDRATFDAARTGLEIARQLRRLHREEWKAEDYARLLGNSAVYEALLAGESVEQMQQKYEPELHKFVMRRRAFLLYEP